MGEVGSRKKERKKKRRERRREREEESEREKREKKRERDQLTGVMSKFCYLHSIPAYKVCWTAKLTVAIFRDWN